MWKCWIVPSLELERSSMDNWQLKVNDELILETEVSLLVTWQLSTAHDTFTIAINFDLSLRKLLNYNQFFLLALITVLMKKECHRWNCNERNLVANHVLGNYTERESNYQCDNISVSDRVYLPITNAGKSRPKLTLWKVTTTIKTAPITPLHSLDHFSGYLHSNNLKCSSICH